MFGFRFSFLLKIIGLRSASSVADGGTPFLIGIGVSEIRLFIWSDLASVAEFFRGFLRRGSVSLALLMVLGFRGAYRLGPLAKLLSF